MVYVTMTDKFMSGWGLSAGKINKLVFVCENMTQAKIVYDNALARTDMKYVNIRTTKPYYNKEHYFTQEKTPQDYPAWYEEGYF